MPDEKKSNVSAPSASADGSKDEPRLTKVKLLKDHEHAREKHKAGDEIEVNAADEKWLRDNKVI